MGYICTCARADVLLIGISETSWWIALKFRWVVRDPSARHLQKLRVGHSCTCAPFFSYLGNGWTECAASWWVLRGPLALRFTKDRGYPHERTCNCIHFKHICSLPLVHRPKGVLLVDIQQFAKRSINPQPGNFEHASFFSITKKGWSIFQYYANALPQH